MTFRVSAKNLYGCAAGGKAIVSELAVLAIAPGPHVAIYVESQAVTLAGGDGNHIFQR
jgi:hypothetical protein